jgi:thiol-disulfide isomerase/thioredoxin
MIRSVSIPVVCMFAVLMSGCGEAPATRPTRPESSEPPPAAATANENSDAKTSDVKSETPARTIDLVESTWDELQSLIAQNKGKIVVVDVWSTACEPCMVEFPHLIELHQRFPNEVVAISYDVDFAGIKNKPPAYYRERVLEFLGSQQENQVLHRMSTIAADELFNQIDLASIPAIYVYGRDGTLLKRFEGENFSYEKQVIPFVGDQIKAAAAN